MGVSNCCIFIGRTTRDLELRYSQGAEAKAFGSTSLAVDDGYGDNKRTSFFKITLFGKTAESFQKYVPKGTKVAIQARASQEKWKDKDGNSREMVAFLVDGWTFAGGTAEERKPTQSEASGFTPAEEEELPFF